MKPQPIFLIIIIAIGAITGSTLATISYLKNRTGLPGKIGDSYQNESVDLSEKLNLNKRESDRNLSNYLHKNSKNKLTKPKFSEFREAFLDAVKHRDEVFIQALVTPQSISSFGRALELESYEIDRPDSPFWEKIEKAVAAGCVVDRNAKANDLESGDDVWVCPHTYGKEIYSSGWEEKVAILGERVNVRSQPRTDSRIIGILSKEVAKFDSQTFNNSSQTLQELLDQSDGWTPVILKNGQKGWVQNRFTYYEPRDYRVSFVRTQGQWRLRYLLSGEGN